jgi:hypothetical protein
MPFQAARPTKAFMTVLHFRLCPLFLAKITGNSICYIFKTRRWDSEGDFHRGPVFHAGFHKPPGKLVFADRCQQQVLVAALQPGQFLIRKRPN